MEEQYFVQIRDPLDMRRSILGSSKQIIHILQRYERIKDLRVRKLDKISQLKAMNKEINLIIAKLKKKFPEAGFRVKLGKEEKKPSVKKSRVSGNELYQLESELRQIEKKLGKLT